MNRDIKLENTLLDGSKRPLLKICDFGYSKNDKDSVPKSKVGTPGYTGARAPHLFRLCPWFCTGVAASSVNRFAGATFERVTSAPEVSDSRSCPILRHRSWREMPCIS